MKLLALVPMAALVACEPAPVVTTPSSTIDLAQVVGDSTIRGVSVHGSDLDVLVEGRGLLTVTRDGELLSERTPGERGLWEADYNDVAHLGDDVFVLLADPEGYLYDSRTQRQSVHFCVEPGWEPEPDQPVLTQRNDAVAASGNLIVAAPRFYEDGVLRESSLRTYLAGDGAPISSTDLAGLELTGLALHGTKVFGVQLDELHAFTTDGEHLSTTQLEGTETASGIAVDGASVLVSDGESATIRVYDLE